MSRVTAVTPVVEEVVLLDDDGHEVGTTPKATVHGAATPLHLAFSCYLFVPGGVLLTRRSDTKRTFPGVWTNALCGHPLPGETLVSSVTRRARDELGLEVADITLRLPRFRYRAEMLGIVEHEWCPVVTARTTSPVTPVPVSPDPSEVSDWAVVPWPALVARAEAGQDLSPWSREQVPLLAALGPQPAAWPVGDRSLLPPALAWD